MNLGAADYISKPFNVDVIKMTVAKVLEMRRSRAAASGAPTSEGLDSLTRLCGVTIFTGILEKEIERSGWKGRACSLLMADVSEFETLPASSDASERDRPLRVFATILELETRPGDTMGRTDSRRAGRDPARNRSRGG